MTTISTIILKLAQSLYYIHIYNYLGRLSTWRLQKSQLCILTARPALLSGQLCTKVITQLLQLLGFLLIDQRHPEAEVIEVSVLALGQYSATEKK